MYISYLLLLLKKTLKKISILLQKCCKFEVVQFFFGSIVQYRRNRPVKNDLKSTKPLFLAKISKIGLVVENHFFYSVEIYPDSAIDIF